jgi:alpha-mannosidase
MSAQKIHLIGNAHIDPVWLWRWTEGYAEIKATFQSALDRMKEFPDLAADYPRAVGPSGNPRHR